MNNMAIFAAAEKFLARHLGGRYQEGMTDEVAARLREIVVDAKSVVLAKPVDVAAVGLPRPCLPVSTGTSSYLVTVAMGGQTMSLTASTEIRREGEAVFIVERVRTPMGEATDTVALDLETLALRWRSIAQGPMAIAFEVKDGKAIGEAKMGGQTQPISVELGGTLLADGAGAHQVLATLPLAEGYTASFRNLDVRTQKVKVRQLSCTDSETVTVPAGTFDAFKVEVATVDEAEKATVWVAKEGRRVVKVSAVAPQMSGALVVSELQN